MRSGSGEVRTILLLHIISVRPSKQPLMVRVFLKVYVEIDSSFLFLQEQIKDIIIIEATSRRGSVRGGATTLQPWILRLICNANAFAVTRFCCDGSPVAMKCAVPITKLFARGPAWPLSTRWCTKRRISEGHAFGFCIECVLIWHRMCSLIFRSLRG